MSSNPDPKLMALSLEELRELGHRQMALRAKYKRDMNEMDDAIQETLAAFMAKVDEAARTDDIAKESK